MMKNLGILLLVLINAHYTYGQIWKLEDCIDYSRKHNQELIAKTKEIDISQLDIFKERSLLLPHFNFSTTVDYYWKIPVQTYPGEIFGNTQDETVAIPTGTTWMGYYGIDMDLKIVDVELWRKIKLYTLKNQVAKLSVSLIDKIIERNVSMAFNAAQIMKNSSEEAWKYYKIFEYIFDLISAEFEKGNIDKIKLNQSKDLVISSKIFYENKQKEFQESMLDLKYWMGYSLNNDITITDSIDIPEAVFQNFNINTTPEIDIKREQIMIEKSNYKKDIAAFMPKLSLIGNYSNSGFCDKIRNIIQKKTWYPSGFIGFKLYIPISFSQIVQIKRQKATIIQSENSLSSYSMKTEKEFISLVYNMQQIMKDLESLQQKMTLAKENENLSLIKIKSGIIDMIELKQVQEESIKGQMEHSELLIKYFNCYNKIRFLQNKVL